MSHPLQFLIFLFKLCLQLSQSLLKVAMTLLRLNNRVKIKCILTSFGPVLNLKRVNSTRSTSNRSEPDSTHLVECRHPLGELSLDLGQRLGPLEGLLQLLFSIVQTLLELPVLLFTLSDRTMRPNNTEHHNEHILFRKNCALFLEETW